MADDMLEDVVKAYCAAKIQKLHILNQNGANLVNNHALDMAQKLGISTDEANKRLGITPFPSPTNNTNIESKAASPWATAALVAASVLGGAVPAGVVGYYLSKNSEPEAVQQVAEPQDSTFGAVDIDVS